MNGETMLPSLLEFEREGKTKRCLKQLAAPPRPPLFLCFSPVFLLLLLRRRRSSFAFLFLLSLTRSPSFYDLRCSCVRSRRTEQRVDLSSGAFFVQGHDYRHQSAREIDVVVAAVVKVVAARPHRPFLGPRSWIDGPSAEEGHGRARRGDQVSAIR